MDVTSYLLGKKSGGPTPTGTINITENGEHDVTNYASASVNVSGSVETLEQINNAISTYFQKYINLSEDYPTQTTDSVTLYTPHSSFKTYAITKEGGLYRINWINTEYMLCKTSTNLYGVFKVNLPSQNVYDVNEVRLLTGGTFLTWYRSEYQYHDINDCIQAMQDSTTTYTTRSSNKMKSEETGQYQIPFSNTTIIDIDAITPLGSQKISSNETIQVIE